jgi:hypothetical protein
MLRIVLRIVLKLVFYIFSRATHCIQEFTVRLGIPISSLILNIEYIIYCVCTVSFSYILQLYIASATIQNTIHPHSLRPCMHIRYSRRHTNCSRLRA